MTTLLTPLEHYLVNFFSIFGIVGCSFLLCLVNDLITFFSLHVYFIYKVLRALYKFTLEAIKMMYFIMKDKELNIVSQK